MTLAKLREREEGFTLIELLVVIIIIGILAAIAIPTFMNQRQKGWDSAAKSALRNAAIAQESYFTENGAYAETIAPLEAEGYNHSADLAAMTFDDRNQATEYCMQTNHSSSATIWHLESAVGEPATGACP